MTWQRFDPEARTAPWVTFHTAEGGAVALTQFRGQYQLVLFFAHGPQCAHCRALADRFAALADDLQTFDSRVLVVADAAPTELPAAVGGPVRWLADPDGVARARCAQLLGRAVAPGVVLLLVLDPFGSPYAAWAGAEADAPELERQTLEWLAYIAIQCPE
jgi:predicted dithiol-disulfide oxidoreductase (DUF899 family)